MSNNTLMNNFKYLCRLIKVTTNCGEGESIELAKLIVRFSLGDLSNEAIRWWESARLKNKGFSEEEIAKLVRRNKVWGGEKWNKI